MNCYNGEKFLKQSINSVINQTFENWELIFWDNQSNDNSAKIFKSYKDKRLKYYLANTKTSLHEARNLALSKTSGELITFLDTDDYWLKKKLELQVNEFCKKSELTTVYSKILVNYNNRFIPTRVVPAQNLPSGYIYDSLILNYNISFLAIIFKKKNLSNFPKIFNTKFDLISDFDFVLRHSKINEFLPIQKPLMVYRKHKNSMSKKNFKNQILQMRNWIEELRKKKIFSHQDLDKIENHFKYLRTKLEIQNSSFLDFLQIIFNKKIKISKLKLFLYFIFKDSF